MEETLSSEEEDPRAITSEPRPSHETSPRPAGVPQSHPSIHGRRSALGRRFGVLATTLDLMAVAWMTVAGDWFDRYPPLSLGGHHQIVAGLATFSLLLLAGLVVPTEGFSRVTSIEIVVLIVAVGLSAVALAGLLLSVLVMGTTVGLMIKLFRR